jgi:hypothetical protein
MDESCYRSVLENLNERALHISKIVFEFMKENRYRIIAAALMTDDPGWLPIPNTADKCPAVLYLVVELLCLEGPPFTYAAVRNGCVAMNTIGWDYLSYDK